MSAPARVSAVDAARIGGEVAAPNLAVGALQRRPRVLLLAERLQFDRVAIRLLRRLRDQYGPGPLEVRLPRRRVLVVLASADVHRVLSRNRPRSPRPAARSGPRSDTSSHTGCWPRAARSGSAAGSSTKPSWTPTGRCTGMPTPSPRPSPRRPPGCWRRWMGGVSTGTASSRHGGRWSTGSCSATAHATTRR